MRMHTWARFGVWKSSISKPDLLLGVETLFVDCIAERHQGSGDGGDIDISYDGPADPSAVGLSGGGLQAQRSICKVQLISVSSNMVKWINRVCRTDNPL